MDNMGITKFDNGTATVGNITIDNTTGYWPWETPVYPYVTPYVTYTHPQWCSGNVHVFGCDHAEKCQCGKSKRKVEPPRCAHCGKVHC